MLSPGNLYFALRSHNISLFAGIPDSLLKDFCAYIADHVDESHHVICSNEGAAVALAGGHYLATQQPALVYMQNSGLGNAINPLLSLMDPQVYGIPVMLLIGWRGEPDTKDEPQHVKQGSVMIPVLESLDIPHEIIDRETRDIEAVVSRLYQKMILKNCPCALVVRSGTFESYPGVASSQAPSNEPDGHAPEILRIKTLVHFPLVREEAIHLILERLLSDAIVVGTTGMTSREIFEYRESKGEGHERDFLAIGSMGHASQIALGIAMALPNRQVYCIDGDGSTLMHMGSLAVNGTSGVENFTHILINNGAHDSVGGQPTVGFDINFIGVVRSCGYKNAMRADSKREITEALTKLNSVEGPSFLEIRVNKGSRPELGRPTSSPAENKKSFMSYLKR